MAPRLALALTTIVGLFAAVAIAAGTPSNAANVTTGPRAPQATTGPNAR